MLTFNRVKEKNIGNKMPKPRSPEFKVTSRPAPKALVEKTQKKISKEPFGRAAEQPGDTEQSGRSPNSTVRIVLDKKPTKTKNKIHSKGRDKSPSDPPSGKERSAISGTVCPRPSGRQFEEEFDTPPTNTRTNDNSDTGRDPVEVNEFEARNNRKSPYPEAIAKLIEMCLMEADQVRDAFKGRNRQNYVRIFQAYKDKLADRDYSIIRGATGYLYENSRIKSINEDTALWMLGIHEIPISHIQSYTSKAVLEKIAKDCGLNSGKKAEVLIQNIRSVIDSSK